jgi:hypothetical protein
MFEVSGFAAEMACKRKHSKSSSIISSNHIFTRLAFESLGAKKPSISLGIQRGNAASIRGTFPDSALLYRKKILCISWIA